MKVLCLTSSPGYGHIRAAEAITTALHNRYPGIETRCLNVTHLIDAQASSAVQDGYLRMTAEQPGLYQKLYDMDKSLYRQLAGKVPADQTLVDFLAEQQRRSYPEALERPLFSLPSAYNSLDSALLNTLINGICNRSKIPAGRLLLQGLLGLIYSVLATRLKNYVNDYAPDLLIATQMYPNALLSRSIQKGVIRQPIMGVLTDYGTHGVWVRDTTDIYCVSHEQVATSLQQQGISAARIKVTGIPLMQEFENPPSQMQARALLGLDARPTVLVTGGQCGIGITDVVKQLVCSNRRAYQVLVTAGDGCEGHAELQRLALLHPAAFKLYGWGSTMVNLLSAADVVVGKPGGLTVSETLACGKPFIATCCLGGQEAHNVQFLYTQGAGFQVELAQLPTAIDQLFDNPQQLQLMGQRASAAGRRGATSAIVDQVAMFEYTRMQAQRKVH